MTKIENTITENAVRDLIEKKDTVFRNAFKKLGHHDLEGLRGRVLRTLDNEGTETVYLDGKPILEFYNFGITKSFKNGNHIVTATIKYRSV